MSPRSPAAQVPAAQVIVVAYNPGSDLQRCLDALAAQTCTDFEAVVWDNASSDGALDQLSPPPGVEVVRCPDNLGFAAGNNRAAERSQSRYVVTLNPDAFPEPDWLERLVAAADETGAAMVASLQIDDEAPDTLDGAGDCMSIFGAAWRGGYQQPRALAPTERAEVFGPCGAAALYRREVFEAMAGFEERFFCYCEDVDLAFRIRLRGGRCVLEPRAIVRHRGSGTVRSISGFADYHGARNRLWTFVRDMPTVLMPIALPLHIALTLYLVVRLQSVAGMAAPRRAYRRGLWHGLKGMGPFLKERRAWRPTDLRALAAALAWSPLSLSRRGPIARPWRAPATAGPNGGLS